MKKLIVKEVIELTQMPKIRAGRIVEIYNTLALMKCLKASSQKIEVEIFGEKNMETQFHVKHSAGACTFCVPNELADTFNVLLGIDVEAKETEKGMIINLSSDISKLLNTASKFSEKDYRPALEGVLIEIESGSLSIIATDGHVLYKSTKYINTSSHKKDYLFHIKGNFTSLSECTSIEVLKYGLKIGGREFVFSEAKFPNYKVVIPEYSGAMTFEPKQLISTLKSVSAMANKVTHKVGIYFNGCIQVSAEDIDFGNDCTAKMPYKSKTFEDCEIGFNSKLLIKSLSVFKDKLVTLKTEGVPNKAVTLHGANEIVLCMPQILNK